VKLQMDAIKLYLLARKSKIDLPVKMLPAGLDKLLG
jgi:hypothetical protein